MAQSISGGGGGSAHGALGSSAIAGLMAMADYCLIHKPQQIKEAVHCMMACLSLSPPPRVEARVRLQLGLTLYHHSNNLLEARETLEQAMLLSNSVSGIEQIRYEAASILGRIHLEQGYASKAKVVLKSVMETSHRLSYWHCRLLLQKADIHLYEKDFDSLISTLTAAADYAHQVNAPHTRILCLLAKGAHLLILKQHQEATATLNLTLTLVDQCQGSKAILLKTFYLIIQVTHLLGFGLMKAAKPHLKELQHNVKLLNSEAQRPVEPEGLLTAESFEWLTVEQTYILVYLVCMMHSVLVGSTEKALSFAKKALYVINSRKGSSGSGNASVLLVFEAHILELIVSCMLMQGNCVEAGEKLQEVVNVCHKHPQMVYSHRAVLHSLLGAYAFTTNDDERSVVQFQAALQHTNSLELKVYINVNLAITYLRIGASKIRELMAIMDFLQSEDVNSLNSKNLKAAVLFVKGLNAYYQVRPHEAKRHLRETLSLSNSNDLNKLSACALLVLGQIFLSLGNSKEARDMLDPAFKLSHKMRDKKLQSWATSLLIGLHKSVEDKGSQESSEESLRILQSELLTDYTKAKESSHHSLIQWTVGDWPIREEEMETGSVPMATAMVADDRHDYGTREEMDTADLRTHHVTDHVSKHVIPQNDYLTSGTGHVTSDHVTSHVTSRANRRLSHKGHRTDHVISQTDHVTNRSGSQKSDFMQSARHVTGHVTEERDHVALHENGRHSQINQPFQPHHMTSEQDHMTSEQGHVTSKHRSSVDHMTLHSNRTAHSHVDSNRTDHMTLHVNQPLTSNKKNMPLIGGGDMRDEIPLDVSVKQRKSDKSPQLPFNQGSSSSGLFSPPPPLTHSPSYPTPPAGSNSPYSRYYSHLPPSSSSPIPTTLTPPPSDQASATTHTPRQQQNPHHFSSHSSRVGSDSLHASGGQHQLQHSSQSSSPSLQGYSSSAPQLGAGRQHRTTPHQANSANSQLYSAASQPEHTASSQYPHVPSSKQQGPATSQSPLQSASSEYAASHKQHSIPSSNTQGTSPQYTAPKHTSPQYTGHSSPQYSSPLQHQQKQQQQQHNPASAQQGSSPGVHQGVTGHQPGLSSPLLHGLPQLKHMGTLPSADSVLMRSYPSPGGNHSPHVARGSPSQPGSAAASPYQANSLSLLQQQQVPGGVLMQQQFPHVYNSPTQRQLQHHQLQQQQFPGNDMVLHQYGYSALTPEALMRQREKLAQQQQQQLIPTGGAAAGSFSPFPHHHPVLGGGALQYRTQAPRMNLYQYHAGGAQVPPSSLSPPTPGHLNYIYHHRNLSKNPNMPHQ